MSKKTLKTLTLGVLVLGLIGVFSFAGSASAVSPNDYGLKEGDLIRASGDNDIFIVNQFGYKRLFLNPAIFNMYGHLGGWANVKTVSPAVRDAFKTSPYYRADGDTKVYRLAVTGDDTGTLHWVNVSQSEFLANADPNSVFTINGLELAWYAKGSDYTFAPVPTPVVGLSAKLASDNPSGATLPKDANRVTFAKVDFSGSGDIKELKVKRTGLGTKDELTNVYLYADGVRVTDEKTFNSDNQIEFKNLKLHAPVSVAVVADLSATPGNEHAVTVVSVVSDSSVNGLPLSGNTFRISGASVGSLEIVNSGTIDDPVVGQDRAKVSEFKLSVPTDDENVTVKSIQLEQTGSADISNLRLVVDGKEYSGSINSDDEVVFSSLNITILDGKSKKFEVFADIDDEGNVGETLTLDLVRPSDIFATGEIYGYGVSVTDSFVPQVGVDLVASGNLDVKAVSNGEQVAYFGQSVSNVAKFKFTAEESEGFYIEELNFDSGASLSANVDSLSITYKNKSGATLTKTESVDGVGSVSFDSFADADRPYVPADGSMELAVGFELTNDEDSSRFVDFKLVLDGFKAVGASSDDDKTVVVNEDAKDGLYTYASYLTVKRESPTGDLSPTDDVEFSLTAHSDNATSAFVGGGYGSISLDVFHASGSASFEDVGWTAYADGNQIASGSVGESGTLTINFDEDVELEDGDTVNIKLVFDGLEDFVYDDGDRFTLTLKDADGVLKWVDDFDGENVANVQNVADLDNALPIKFYYKN